MNARGSSSSVTNYLLKKGKKTGKKVETIKCTPSGVPEEKGPPYIKMNIKVAPGAQNKEVNPLKHVPIQKSPDFREFSRTKHTPSHVKTKKGRTGGLKKSAEPHPHTSYHSRQEERTHYHKKTTHQGRKGKTGLKNSPGQPKNLIKMHQSHSPRKHLEKYSIQSMNTKKKEVGKRETSTNSVKAFIESKGSLRQPAKAKKNVEKEEEKTPFDLGINRRPFKKNESALSFSNNYYEKHPKGDNLGYIKYQSSVQTTSKDVQSIPMVPRKTIPSNERTNSVTGVSLERNQSSFMSRGGQNSFHSPDVIRQIEKNQRSIQNVEKFVLQKKLNQKLFEAVEAQDSEEIDRMFSTTR